MNVKKFKRTSFLVSFYVYNYIQNKKFKVGKFENFFRVGRLTGNRVNFFGLSLSNTAKILISISHLKWINISSFLILSHLKWINISSFLILFFLKKRSVDTYQTFGLLKQIKKLKLLKKPMKSADLVEFHSWNISCWSDVQVIPSWFFTKHKHYSENCCLVETIAENRTFLLVICIYLFTLV